MACIGGRWIKKYFWQIELPREVSKARGKTVGIGKALESKSIYVVRIKSVGITLASQR